MNLGPEDLKREIDEVLEEIDRVEAEVLELFADLGGDEALRKVVAYKRQQERQSPLNPILGSPPLQDVAVDHPERGEQPES
jgi:hypothetical protein